MRTRMISNDELARKWYLIVEKVDRSLAHGSGTLSAHGLFLQCMGAAAQCWIREDEWGCIHGVAITRYEMYETTKVLGIAVTTSEGWFEHGPDILETIEEFAKATDCKKVAVYGRKGWKKALEPYGYKEPYTVLFKEV